MKIIFLISLALSLCGASKILIVFPNPSKSHGILGEGYVRHLLKAGHEITYITVAPIKNSSKNLRQIDVSSNFKFFDELLEKVDGKDIFSLQFNWQLFEEGINALNNTLKNEVVQKLLYDPSEKFDAVIVEWLFSELFSGFAAVFNCPLIWSSSMEPHALVLSLIDEAPNSAYFPDIMSNSLPPFTFFERVAQLVSVPVFRVIRWYYVSGIEEKLYEDNFAAAITKRGRIPPSYQEVIYSGSLMLGNSHVSTGLAIRLPQNYKAISGYHINEEIPPLSEKFQKLMNESKDGVIYFSLGSVVPAHKLPNETKQAFIEIFRNLKQTVIWKFGEKISDLPKNVHIFDWAPQQSILAHQNCILFITHGGLLSMIETVHYGKPVIGMPVFGDQFINTKRAVQKGFGLEVLLLDVNISQTLKTAVQEMISNPRYTERVKELSYVYHHRLAKPGEELVHWVEHVIHTRGAPDLQSPALHVPWYQKMYLDLMAVVVLLVYIIIRIVKFVNSSVKEKVGMTKKNN